MCLNHGSELAFLYPVSKKIRASQRFLQTGVELPHFRLHSYRWVRLHLQLRLPLRFRLHNRLHLHEN